MTTIKYKPLIHARVGFIVVHCSATKPSADWDVNDVRRAHLQRGFVDVGYHYVIKRDGTLQTGRPLNRQGAHAERFNHLSVGVCMIGGVSEEDHTKAEDNFTAAQFETLKGILAELRTIFPHAEILGHRDLPNVRKDCPCFDVRAEIESGRLKP